MANKKSSNKISNWYNDRSIFITGGTGFMGKVLVEKLLYSCPGIKTIYLLTRNKRGKSIEKRFEDMWKLPMFERLHKSQPNAFKKVIPLRGELNSEGLGLNEHDLNLIIENVSVVFHCAATLKLEATLKDAIEQNAVGTVRMIDVAKQIKNLKAFIHYSTAFCSADIDIFEEKVYDCKDNPRDVIQVTQWMSNDTLELATPELIKPHPNTYTYSKRLAEKLVADEFGKMAVCIVRPSVDESLDGQGRAEFGQSVTSSLPIRMIANLNITAITQTPAQTLIVIPAGVEPLPGWVDSLNGPMGLLIGAGKGVIRSMHCKGENRAQVVPVDIAINATIIIAYKVGTNTTGLEGVPVYNITNDEVLHITYDEILSRGRNIMYENPFEGQIWYPDGDIRSSKFIHNLFCLFCHWLPAYFIDFLMFIFRQKRFMVRLQSRIHFGLELLQFFTVREWLFRSKNFLNLKNGLNEEEFKEFHMNFNVMPINDYLKVCILGARQYLMKESLDTIPRCRIQQKILYVLHKLFVFGLYFLIFWSIISLSPTAKNSLSVIGNYTQMIPVFGNVISKH